MKNGRDKTSAGSWQTRSPYPAGLAGVAAPLNTSHGSSTQRNSDGVDRGQQIRATIFLICTIWLSYVSDWKVVCHGLLLGAVDQVTFGQRLEKVQTSGGLARRGREAVSVREKTTVFHRR